MRILKKTDNKMDLTQFAPEVQDRIREHLSNYKSGTLVPQDQYPDETESEALYIYADTLEEAKAIVETAILMGHYSAFIPQCCCEHDCCACVSTSAMKLVRIDNLFFIAIHSFTINV